MYVRRVFYSHVSLCVVKHAKGQELDVIKSVSDTVQSGAGVEGRWAAAQQHHHPPPPTTTSHHPPPPTTTHHHHPPPPTTTHHHHRPSLPSLQGLINSTGDYCNSKPRASGYLITLVYGIVFLSSHFCASCLMYVNVPNVPKGD